MERKAKKEKNVVSNIWKIEIPNRISLKIKKNNKNIFFFLENWRKKQNKERLWWNYEEENNTKNIWYKNNKQNKKLEINKKTL